MGLKPPPTGIEKCKRLSLILRDDPKPRVDCDRHEDMDAAHNRIELQLFPRDSCSCAFETYSLFRSLQCSEAADCF